MKRLLLLVLLVIPAVLPLESFIEKPSDEIIAADTLCFSRDILPIYNSNCAMSGCHDAVSRRGNYNLTTYAGIMRGIKAGSPSASNAYKIINVSMPEAPWKRVPDSLKTRIATWITAGAKNDACTTSSCDTANVTYLKDIKPILQVNCVGCHQTNSAGGGFKMDVDAVNDANKMTIYQSAAHIITPMPRNIAQLDECQIAKLRVWATKTDAVANDANSDQNFRIVQHDGEEILRFQLDHAATATITLSAADGRTVMSIPSTNYNAGFNELRLNSAQLNHGLYFVRYVSGTTVRSLKFLR